MTQTKIQTQVRSINRLLDLADTQSTNAIRTYVRACEELVAGYAYARTGYHRGLDQLRRAGWKGNGPIPWDHEPNRGFLRALHALGRAAGAIGETEEEARCQIFLADSSAAAVVALDAS